MIQEVIMLDVTYYQLLKTNPNQKNTHFAFIVVYNSRKCMHKCAYTASTVSLSPLQPADKEGPALDCSPGIYSGQYMYIYKYMYSSMYIYVLYMNCRLQ